MSMHVTLETGIEFPFLGYGIGSSIVHVGRIRRHSPERRIPHCDQQIPAATCVFENDCSGAYGMATVRLRKIQIWWRGSLSDQRHPPERDHAEQQRRFLRHDLRPVPEMVTS